MNESIAPKSDSSITKKYGAHNTKTIHTLYGSPYICVDCFVYKFNHFT